MMIKSILDFFYPSACPSCHEFVEDPHQLCPKCWGDIAFITAPYCESCGMPLPYDMGENPVCVACLTNPPPLTQSRAAVTYNEISRGLILGFKHGDKTHLARMFARWLLPHLSQFSEPIDAILPIPLHWTRLWRRYFNQAALIAQALSKQSGIPYWPDALIRQRATPSQGGLNQKQRHDNVKNAFMLRPRFAPKVAGKNILLIDDVYTTGATLHEAAKALRQEKARNVFALTIARVTNEKF